MNAPPSLRNSTIGDLPVDVWRLIATHTLADDLFALIMTGNRLLIGRVCRSTTKLGMVPPPGKTFDLYGLLHRATLFLVIQEISITSKDCEPEYYGPSFAPTLGTLTSLSLHFPTLIDLWEKYFGRPDLLWPSLEILRLSESEPGALELSLKHLPKTLQVLSVKAATTTVIALSDIMELPVGLETLILEAHIGAEDEEPDFCRFPWPSLTTLRIHTSASIDFKMESLPSTLQSLDIWSFEPKNTPLEHDFRIITPKLRSIRIANDFGAYYDTWDILERMPTSLERFEINLEPAFKRGLNDNLELIRSRAPAFQYFEPSEWMVEALPYFTRLEALRLMHHDLQKHDILPPNLKSLRGKSIASIGSLPLSLTELSLATIVPLDDPCYPPGVGETERAEPHRPFPASLKHLALHHSGFRLRSVALLPESLETLSAHFDEPEAVGALPDLLELSIRLRNSLKAVNWTTLARRVPNSVARLVIWVPRILETSFKEDHQKARIQGCLRPGVHLVIKTT